MNDPYRPSGLDAPNVMWPATWVILAVVLAAILAGFTYLLIRYLKTRIPWKALPGSSLGAVYHMVKPVDPTLLAMAVTAAYDFLVQHTTWRSLDIAHALRGLQVYVMDTPAWVDSASGKVAGTDPAGPAVVVGSDYAALLHEMAHQVEQVAHRVIDYQHAGWEANGIRKAEDEFAKWLSTQRVASGMSGGGVST